MKTACASTLASALIACLLLLSPVSAREIPEPPSTDPALSPRTMTRKEDPVIVSGRDLPGMSGRPVEGLRAFALREGAMAAIPYQVDELDPKGRIVCPEGKDPRKDEDEGLLDANDEVVVMAADLGERAPRSLYPEEARAASEIEVADPDTGEKAWFYLFDFDAPPPPSQVSYVRYDPVKDLAESPLYILDFNERRSILLDDLRIKRPGGDPGPNLIDRIKIRTAFKTRLFITFRFDEEDISTHVTAYKNGPIRSVRSADYYLKLFFIKVTPSAHVDYLFYRNGVVGPSELKIPFNPKIVLRGGSRAISGLDFASAVHGWRFYAARNRTPVVLNGKTMNGEGLEKEGVSWFVVYGEDRGTVTRGVYGSSLIKAKQEYVLYYNDDEERENRPEREKGETMLGFNMDILRLPRGSHRIWFYQFFASPFAVGDEKKFNDILDRPLTARAQAVSLPRTSNGAGAGSARRPVSRVVR
jgi:hypothetical protein